MLLKLLQLLQLRTLVLHQLTPRPELPIESIRSLQTSLYQFRGRCSEIVNTTEYLQDQQVRRRIVLTAGGFKSMEVIQAIQECYPHAAVICVIRSSHQVSSEWDNVTSIKMFKCCDVLLMTDTEIAIGDLVVSVEGLDVYTLGPLESSCGPCGLLLKGGARRPLQGSVVQITGMSPSPVYYFQQCEGPWELCGHWITGVSNTKKAFQPPILSQKNPYKGFETRLVESIATALNVSLYTRASKFTGHYGNGFKNGEPDGILGLLYDRRVMIAIGDLTLNHVRFQFVDFTSPHDFDNWGVVTNIEKAPLTLQFFLSLLGEYSVSAFIVLMVLTFNVLVVAKPFSLSRVWLCLAFVCQPSDPSPLQHERGGSGIAMISWQLGTYLVLNIVSGVLTIYSVMPAIVNIPSTLKEAIDQSGLTFIAFGPYPHHLLAEIAEHAPQFSSERKVFLDIRARCQIVSRSETRRYLEMRSSKLLIITEALAMAIDMRSTFKEDFGTGARFIAERIMVATQGIALQKGCRYNAAIQRLVRHLQEGDLVEKFKQLAGVRYLDTTIRTGISYTTIYLNNIGTFLAICVYLAIVSIGVLIVEILIKRFAKGNTSRKAPGLLAKDQS